LSAGPAPRVVVIYAHAEPQRSRVNRHLADAARAMPGVLVHDLYATYPDFFIDAAREQALLADASLIVLLHPIRWYAMPALLKEWIDVVFEAGWAYGKDATALKDKAFLLAVSTGGTAAAYSAEGIHGRPFDDFLPPYEQTALLCKMTWQPPLVLHGAHHASERDIAAHVDQFRLRLGAFLKEAN
jgi:putative NADPH-quinone reductase